jgi:hypothetical protein
VRLGWICVLLAACSGGSRFSGECEKGGDCPVGATCRISPTTGAGLCVCRSDEACDPGEICNSQGVCQLRSGCRSNAECESSKFCDFGTGACIDRTACGSDVHCLPGTVCQGSRCVDGCYSTADCPLYSSCEGGGGTLGRCIAGKCDDKSFCDFGSNCTAGMCAVNTDPNHCAYDCQGNGDCGGGGRNFCLVNPAYEPGNPRSNYQTFCGVECDAEADCPSGYNCGGVVLLTQDQCQNDAACGGGGRRCFIGEGDLRGFCSCVNDQDCAFDAAPPTCNGVCQNPPNRACSDDSQCDPLPICGPYLGPGQGDVCVTDGTPCNGAADCLCSGGTCINTGRPCSTGPECNPPCMNGGCVLGAACAPEEGLLCTDVR